MNKETPNQQTISISISYDPFIAKFLSEIDIHLASLRNVLTSISNKTYAEVASTSVRDGFLGLTLTDNADVQSDIEDAEILKAFVNIMRSFVDFLDSLVGVMDILENPPVFSKSIKSVDQLLEQYDKAILNRIQKVARNRSLTNIVKLEKLPKLSDNLDVAIRGYFSLRSSIEHHKSVAGKNAVLSVQRQAFFTEDNTEIKNNPISVIEGPQTISLKVKWDITEINEGSTIKLTEKDLEALILTFKLCIVPELITKLTAA